MAKPSLGKPELKLILDGGNQDYIESADFGSFNPEETGDRAGES